MKSKVLPVGVSSSVVASSSQNPMLLSDIRELIESCRQRVAVGVNAELTFLY